MDDNRDILLPSEEREPVRVLAKELEPVLKEYRIWGELSEGVIALVGRRSQMTALLQRFLIYKGYDVVRFSTLEQIKSVRASVFIFNLDAMEAEDVCLAAKQSGAIAYTKDPEGVLVKEGAFSLVIPFPFDPYEMLEQLRDQLKNLEKKQREDHRLCCDLPSQSTDLNS